MLPVAVPISTSSIKAKTDSTSVFAQFDYRFTDALKATVGVRYTEDRKKFDFSFVGKLPPITPATGLVNLKDTYSQTTPRNDPSPARGQWNLDNAYRYVSEAYGGYHWDAMHGVNLDAGIFMSYVGLWSY